MEGGIISPRAKQQYHSFFHNISHHKRRELTSIQTVLHPTASSWTFGPVRQSCQELNRLRFLKKPASGPEKDILRKMVR
jgi:pantothenate kinase type III